MRHGGREVVVGGMNGERMVDVACTRIKELVPTVASQTPHPLFAPSSNGEIGEVSSRVVLTPSPSRKSTTGLGVKEHAAHLRRGHKRPRPEEIMDIISTITKEMYMW